MKKRIKYSVLIVDDVSENIDVLNGVLKKDYDVYFAKSGKMALNFIAKSKPDLILLDIMMPEMDGYEVCRIIKSNPKTMKTPVIFVTANDQELDEIKCFEVGAVDYITKPVSPNIVLARVKTHLDLYNQNKSLEIKIAERTEEISKTRLQIIQKLCVASEYKDNETGEHIKRMGKYSYIIAKNYGYSEYDANILQNAAPIHDIGKIGISDKILLKPGKLDANEWDTMTTHTRIGANIIGKNSSGLLGVAYTVALEHHEKWNGKGYPKGLKESEINIAARIVAIADVFDALLSERPYKKAWELDKAIDLINEEAGQHFDPELVKVFNDSLPEILKARKTHLDK